MQHKSRHIKGPRPNEHKVRMQLRIEQETRDQEELAEYHAAMQSGDQARALEIARARQARSRAAQHPQGVIESESARAGATEPLLAVPQTPVSTSPALAFASGAAVYHELTLETGKLVTLQPQFNERPRWVVQWDENGERQLVWEADLRLGTPPIARPSSRLQPLFYGRGAHGAGGAA